MNPTPCPKCAAELPARGRFCLECGLDLYQAGARRAPAAWARGALAAAAAVVVLALVVLATRGKLFAPSEEAPPEERAVRELSREVLRLAAEGRHAELVRRHFMPNAEEFRRIEGALNELVRGRGAPALTVFRANCIDDPREARKLVERFGTEHPEYVLALLTALTFQGGALEATLGGALLGSQRAEDFCAWHLAIALPSAAAAGAQVGEIRWADGPGGERILVAAISYPEPHNPPPGFVDTTALRWRLTPGGAWALSLGSDLLLGEVLAFLLKARQ